MSATIWRSWRPEAVREMVVAHLVENGEIAGKFLETEARRRLLAVKEPAWGAGYRRYVAVYMLTSLVVVEERAVVVWVGVKLGAKGSQHGLWLELGTRRTRGRPGNPPISYLRGSVFDNARDIVALMAGR